MSLFIISQLQHDGERWGLKGESQSRERSGGLMPSGTRHELIGRLLRVRDEFLLLVDGGPRWTLALSYSAEKFVGRRVSVIGSRDEDGCLFVQELWPV
jgi:hypothetical protein